LMNLNSVKLIYFSPTGTTRKVAEGIARGLGVQNISTLDLTLPDSKQQEPGRMDSDLVIIGTPVYGGRVPLEAVSRLKRLKADRTPAVVMVAYGNRAFDDALLELKNLVVELGFTPVAGGAFIGEHSYSNETTSIAGGRPDEADLEKARAFGQAVARKLSGLKSTQDISVIEVPGNIPHKERGTPNSESPVTEDSVCILCGTCASVCPMSAVTVNGEVKTDGNRCIMCCACVKNCPSGARIVSVPRIQKAVEWLSSNYSARREPEIFL